MEIPSLLYLCFWAIVSILALIPLRVLLNKVDQFSNQCSQLQQFVQTFLIFSLSYAFLFNPSLSLPERASLPVPPIWCYPFLNIMLFYSFVYVVEDDSTSFLLLVAVTLFMSASCLFTILAICLYSDVKPLSMHIFHWFAWVIFTALTTVIYQDVDHAMKIEFNNPLLPFAVAPTMAYLLCLYQHKLQSAINIRIPLSIKIIVGLIGNILANHYLQDKSILVFWLIVSLAIFWFGNIAMMQSTCQAGIFGFLVGVILDIAGEIFGLNQYMWVVGGGCALLLVFGEYLDKFNLRYPGVSGHKRKEEAETSSV